MRRYGDVANVRFARNFITIPDVYIKYLSFRFYLWLFFINLLHPRRINTINRIIPDISIEVKLILIPDRIGLEEPAQRGGVNPCPALRL